MLRWCVKRLRQCLHPVIESLNERHLRRLVREYLDHFNSARVWCGNYVQGSSF